MAETFQHVRITAQDGVAVLSLDHPEVMNAVSPAMIGAAMTALKTIEKDHSLRALVLTGEGKAFCAGANLTEAAQTGLDAGAVLETVYHPFLRALRGLRMPVVTAVNGPAVGIGMSLALMGDMTIAARSAYFLCGFVRIGLVPDGGATWLLPRLIGLARAREMALLAEPLPAQKALEWGLINAVTEDDRLRDQAVALAQRLAKGPASLPLTRKLFWDSADNNYDQQLAQEQAAQGRAAQSADFKEGLAAFLMKRPPNFTGK